MSTIKNRRVVIASLFLPNTALLGAEDVDAVHELPTIPSPGTHNGAPILSMPKPMTHARRVSGPITSILDDLAGKSRAVTPTKGLGNEINPLFSTMTPLGENVHPFSAAGSTIPSKATTPLSRPPVSRLTTANNQEFSRRTAQSQDFALPLHIPHRVHRKVTRTSSVRRTRSSESGGDSPAGQPWHIDHNPHCNGGLHNAVQSIDARLKDKLWVGTLGGDTDGLNGSLRRSIDARMAKECDSLPVWIPDEEFGKYYDEFCHQVLWPCLHYVIPDAPKTKYFYESSAWTQYKTVNQRFADAIVANYKDGDIIWVNDYHLMLLPAMIREKLPQATIGFFMHVAFPSSEIFRCLAVREPILRGILGADLVGFQTANYARHFRQTVARILSFETVPKGIQCENNFVDVGVFPMGIDVQALQERKQDQEVQHWVGVLKERYANVKLVVGRDKLDEVQGVRHKIAAFEEFLTKFPEYQGKVVLLQVALHTTEENEHHGGVSDVVARLNSRFSSLTYQPVVFLHTEDLSFAQYLALLTVADAFIVTSMREGMALRSHEFVECQEGRHRPLILSEFTGTYSYSGFRSCIPINPWDTRNTAKAIHQALSMDDEEARTRWEDLHAHVVTQTAQAFATSFLTRCVRTHAEHTAADSDPDAVAVLDTRLLLPRYKHSQSRILLLDLEYTLWQRDPAGERGNEGTSMAVPEEALDIVRRLSEDKRNEIWLLSGLRRDGLENILGVVPKVGLVAENGCYIRTIPDKNSPGEWVSMVEHFDLAWKAPTIEILNYFSERTPGSWLEEREASIVWRYCAPDAPDGDRQWARRQAAEAQNHIFDSLGERFGLRIIPGASSFLVLPNFISRSSAVGAILHPAGPGRAPRGTPVESADVGEKFVFALGNDEKLLRRLGEVDGVETCSTRVEGKTDARWRCAKADVLSMLRALADSSTQ